MALAEFGKQLAQQVVGEKIQNVVDSLRPPDAAKIAESVKQEKPAPPSAGETLGSVVIGQIQAMQRACKEDQELLVLCEAAHETLRVLEIYAPTWQVLVLTGIDAERNVTRIVSPVNTVKLVCKVVAVHEGAKPARVGLIVPKVK